MNKGSIGICAAIVAATILAGSSHAQEFPDTMWVKVVFYDFHADGSNPEFQMDNNYMLEPGMVLKNQLDYDTVMAGYFGRDSVGRPIRDLANIRHNYYMHKWFRPWEPGDSTIPNYLNADGRVDPSYPTEDVGHDTAFINYVIEEQLPFIYSPTLGDGVYQFSRTGENGEDQFFWIDDTGFGAEPPSAGSWQNPGHNFAFAMELHTVFTYKPGLKFEFQGDDDVWVFINDTLAMDLGGVHSAEYGEVNIDSLGLVAGRTYTFDLFYCERHTKKSTIRIQTNIPLSPPTKLELVVNDDTASAGGDPVTIAGQILNADNNVIDSLSDSIKWIIDPNDIQPGDALTPSQGSQTQFTATRAYRTVRVIATYYDPYFKVTLIDTANIYVDHGTPDHLVIEGPSGGANSLNADAPITRVTLPNGVQSTEDVYAILRDQYGNYVGPVTNATWGAFADPDLLVSASQGTNISSGQGRITRIAYPDASDNNTGVWAADPARPGFRDTVDVRVDVATYTDLRVLSVTGSQETVIDTLRTTTEDTTLLIVQALRDDGTWVDYFGTWSINPSLNSRFAPGTDSWKYSPQDTGSAVMTVSNGSLSANVHVFVQPGTARRLVLYTAEGNPANAGVDAFGDRAEISTDDSLFMVAKVFDGRNIWLPSYEGARSAEISWRILDASPPSGTFQDGKIAGHSNTFLPYLVRQNVRIIASLEIDPSEPALEDTLIVRIIPGKPSRIEIIQDTTSLSVRPTEIDFPRTDTLRSLYGITLDAKGNFIQYASNADWSSSDTGIIYAENGNFLYGEGQLYRRTETEDFTYAHIIDTLGNGTILRDSILVRISSVTYDSLRIYNTTANGKKYLDTLSLRVGELDTLYAEGKNSATGLWRQIPVTWSKTSGLQIVRSAPTASSQWIIEPSATGEGTISVSLSGAQGDQVHVIFLPGTPNRIAIYRNTGDPSTQTPYSATPPPVTAGTSRNLVAKVFYDNDWFPQFEHDSVLNYFSWSIERIAGRDDISADTLSSRKGYVTSFRPVRAHTTYRITATFLPNGLSTQLTFTVLPDTAYYLVIEDDPVNYHPNQQNPYSLEFTSRESEKSAFALLRDRYNNFVGFSFPTTWKSLDTSLVTAREGRVQPEKGEGEIHRVGETGQTFVVARNVAKPFLVDTVPVSLSDVAYDALRIVVLDSIDIDQLNIAADRDTALTVLGLRSHDSAWVPVPATWKFTPADLANALGQVATFTFHPSLDSDTGSGSIIVTYAGATPDTLAVNVTPGQPNKLVIYPAEGVPNIGSNTAYPRTITNSAGQWIPLVGKVFYNSIWLSSYELSPSKSSLVSWKVIETSPDSSGFLEGSTGHKTRYFPIRAGRTVQVVSHVNSLTDTLGLTIIPARPFHLVIEADVQVSEYDPTFADRADTLTISDNTLTTNAYAVVRDSLGNRIDYSVKTSWSADLAPIIVSAASGNSDIGEGVITKDINATDTLTRIYATDQASGLSDTVFVHLLQYHYTELRIVPANPLTAQRVSSDTLNINTNEQVSFIVEGRRSDNPTLWEPVDAQWQASPALDFEGTVPGAADQWTFSPADTGRGIIWVSFGGAAPDTLQAVFSPGPPTQVSLFILTDADKRIAGMPITVQVQIENQDGLVPGTYCASSTYQDTLGSGQRDSLPYVVVDDSLLTLNQRPDTTYQSTQCISGGRDTIQVTLFHAPDNTGAFDDPDSLHQLFLTFGGLKGVSSPFELLPGSVDSIVLVTNHGVVDSLHLRYPNDILYVKAIGYDRFGNEIRSDDNLYVWNTSGSLHPVGSSTPRENIIYGTGQVTADESGYLRASAPGDTSVFSEIYIGIQGPRAVVTATTRDTSGNGYLDRIDLQFSSPISVSDSSVFFDFVVVYGTDTLKIKDIIGSFDSSVTQVSLALEELQTSDPQTAWTPQIHFDNSSQILYGATDTVQITSQDGAGPVIWRVVKTEYHVDDRTQDLVHIELSETVRDSSGSSLSISTADPSSLFDVWIENPDGSIERVSGVFDGIEGFYRVGTSSGGRSWIEFYMENDSTLSESHLLSIRTDTTITTQGDTLLVAEILDKQASQDPSSNNVPVPVVVKYKKADLMTVGPNPFPPSPLKRNDNELINEPPEQIMHWARNNGGTVIVAEIEYSHDTKKITGDMRVYDLTGNLVYHRLNENNLVLSSWKAELEEESEGLRSDQQLEISLVKRMHFYWNGYNDKGMACAPGAYRIVVHVREHLASGGSSRSRTYTAVAGVGR